MATPTGPAAAPSAPPAILPAREPTAPALSTALALLSSSTGAAMAPAHRAPPPSRPAPRKSPAKRPSPMRFPAAESRPPARLIIRPKKPCLPALSASCSPAVTTVETPRPRPGPRFLRLRTVLPSPLTSTSPPPDARPPAGQLVTSTG
ncbi:hypothetical protein BvCmsKSP054_00809 [Escherichia coli]|nr:hypothetical protein BvCmsKSP054_00809 [Escherichia coli]